MKKALFFENAKLLNDEFNINPLMYGSLGLEYLSNINLNSDDIDILIPEVYLIDKWLEFKQFLENKAFFISSPIFYHQLQYGQYYQVFLLDNQTKM